MSELAPFGVDISDEGNAPAERPDFISRLENGLNLNHYNRLVEELTAATVATAEVLADRTASLGAKAEASVLEQGARIAVAAYQSFHDVQSKH
jgi:hypothetical protein